MCSLEDIARMKDADIKKGISENAVSREMEHTRV